jgi:prevent-host-death family protein
MKDIGIRELKARASELVRKVAEQNATYLITRRGRAVGVLAPADFLAPGKRGAGQEAWERLFALADGWNARNDQQKSAVRELAAMRR